MSATGLSQRPAPADRLSVERPAPSRRPSWLRWLDTPLASYYLIVGAASALTVIGLVMVLSSSSVVAYQTHGNSYYYFLRQLGFAIAAFPLAWGAAAVSAAWWRRAAWPLLAVGAVALVAVAIIGQTVKGNQNWITIAGIAVQPSEAAKLALVVWGAAMIARKQELGLTHVPSHLVLPVVPVAGAMIALVMRGNDLGTAVILLIICAAILVAAGVRKRVLALGLLVVGIAVWVLVATAPHRVDRFAMWSGNESCDLHGLCWQATQGSWALATGGVWGVGLGASREKWSWLPEAHNDFIFAVIGEELGLPGSLLVLALFLVLAWGLFRVALSCQDTFVRIATTAVLWWIVGQAFVNIASVLGLLPIVGVPLPLVSYGGSALITTVAALGMVAGFAHRVPGASAMRSARRRVASVVPRRGLRKARR